MQAETDILNREADMPDTVAGPRPRPPVTLATAKDWARRNNTGPLGFSHFAVRSRDVEATRHFYQDVIGLPLIHTHPAKQVPDPVTGVRYDLIHFFFELGDGSAIGFFGVEKGKSDPHILPNHPLQFHFAVQMESLEAIDEVGARLKAAGYTYQLRDHEGSCFSMYIDDPDGIQLELAYHREGWFADVDLDKARSMFDTWIANGERLD